MAMSQSAPKSQVSSVDPIWADVQLEAESAIEREPSLGGFIYATVLSQDRLEDAICHRVSQRLSHPDVDAGHIYQVFQDILAEHTKLRQVFRADLAAVFDRDPACGRYLEPLLYFKGFHALVAYRFAHKLWQKGRRDFALYLQSEVSKAFSVDIHPAAKIGKGILIDHGTSVVVGETTVIEDNVSILHEVTLGGTGKETGDRHPKVRQGVLIGAGAKILGNVEVGEGAKIAAGSVVLKDVPAHTTVAGVPAKMIGTPRTDQPALEMNQSLPDVHIDGGGI